MRILGSCLTILSVMGLVVVVVSINPELFGLPSLNDHFGQLYRMPILTVAALSVGGLILGIKLRSLAYRGRSQSDVSGPDPDRSSHPLGK